MLLDKGVSQEHKVPAWIFTIHVKAHVAMMRILLSTHFGFSLWVKPDSPEYQDPRTVAFTLSAILMFWLIGICEP